MKKSIAILMLICMLFVCGCEEPEPVSNVTPERLINSFEDDINVVVNYKDEDKGCSISAFIDYSSIAFDNKISITGHTNKEHYLKNVRCEFSGSDLSFMQSVSVYDLDINNMSSSVWSWNSDETGSVFYGALPISSMIYELSGITYEEAIDAYCNKIRKSEYTVGGWKYNISFTKTKVTFDAVYVG